MPPETEIWLPSNPLARLMMLRRPTAPSEGKASPRKPKLWIFVRSDPSILEVACRLSARGRSSGRMPQPSSITRISVLPPSEISTRIWRAPASKAFSTSSLTAEAGRSTTSPAAIRLIDASSNWRIRGKSSDIWGRAFDIPQTVACFSAILLCLTLRIFAGNSRVNHKRNGFVALSSYIPNAMDLDRKRKSHFR